MAHHLVLLGFVPTVSICLLLLKALAPRAL